MTPLARLLSLRVELRDEAAAAEVTPEALAAYAERQGWCLVGTTEAHRVYRRGSSELQVPLEAGWPHYGRRVLQELHELAAEEGRSSLAIWAELVGLADPALAVVAYIDDLLAIMAACPRMVGTTAEVVLFQALLALDVRAQLLGELVPRAAYDALRAERGIPSSLHASQRVGLDGIGGFIADLTERATGHRPPSPEAPPQPADVAPGGAIGAKDGAVAQAPAGPVTGQRVLPGFGEGAPARRHTQHRFGGFERRAFPAGPLAPDATIELLVRACPHCSCLHRVGSTGPRQGAQDLYSSDGEQWSTTSPPCHPKRRDSQ